MVQAIEQPEQNNGLEAETLPKLRVVRWGTAKKILRESLRETFPGLKVESERDAAGSYFMLSRGENEPLIIRQTAPFRDAWLLEEAQQKRFQGVFREILDSARAVLEAQEDDNGELLRSQDPLAAMEQMTLEAAAELVRTRLQGRFPECSVETTEGLASSGSLIINPGQHTFRSLVQLEPEVDSWMLLSQYSKENPRGPLEDMLQQLEAELIAVFYAEGDMR